MEHHHHPSSIWHTRVADTRSMRTPKPRVQLAAGTCARIRKGPGLDGLPQRPATAARVPGSGALDGRLVRISPIQTEMREQLYHEELWNVEYSTGPPRWNYTSTRCQGWGWGGVWCVDGTARDFLVSEMSLCVWELGPGFEATGLRVKVSVGRVSVLFTYIHTYRVACPMGNTG